MINDKYSWYSLLAANSCLALFGTSFGNITTKIDMMRGDFKWFVDEEIFNGHGLEVSGIPTVFK